MRVGDMHSLVRKGHWLPGLTWSCDSFQHWTFLSCFCIWLISTSLKRLCVQVYTCFVEKSHQHLHAVILGVPFCIYACLFNFIYYLYLLHTVFFPFIDLSKTATSLGSYNCVFFLNQLILLNSLILNIYVLLKWYCVLHSFVRTQCVTLPSF